MLNHLRDLMKHISGLGIEVIKVTGDEDGHVKIEGMDVSKTVVLKGSFKKEIPEFNGIFGLGDLEYLHKLVNVYKEKGDSVEIIREEKTFSVQIENDGELMVDEDNNPLFEKVTEEVIDQFKFSRKLPHLLNPYRVTDRRMIPEQYNFVGAEVWDVEIKPTKTAIDMLAIQASFGKEEFFGVKTENGTLYLTLGDNNAEAIVEFASNVEGELTRPWVWGVLPVLNILKFSENAECSMSFLDKGALLISLKTGLAEYKYIMPAKSR